MKALQLFRLIGVLALLALYNATALAAMPDAKLEEVSAKKVQQFKTSYMGYPVNQDIQLDARFGGDLAHVVVMQHIDKAMIDRFIADLRAELK